MKQLMCWLFVAWIGIPCFAGGSGMLPDPKLTPGDIFVGISTSAICTRGYTNTVRNVPESLKRRVYAEYGIKWYTGIGRDYEVDHLISLELGGSNDMKNLWPEAYKPRPGAREKDQVENELHREVCSGEITIKEAQYIISNNWIRFYKLMQPKERY